MRRAKATARPIHLLLSDVVMPQLHGTDLAQQIVAMRPDMCVLLMSGYTDDELLRHGVHDGSTPPTTSFVTRSSPMRSRQCVARG